MDGASLWRSIPVWLYLDQDSKPGFLMTNARRGYLANMGHHKQALHTLKRFEEPSEIQNNQS